LVTRFGAIAIAQENEPPAPHDQLPLAVGTLLDDWCHAAGKDCRQRAEYRHPVIRKAELAGEVSAACFDAVEIASRASTDAGKPGMSLLTHKKTASGCFSRPRF
jgi:hypothetical protein